MKSAADQPPTVAGRDRVPDPRSGRGRKNHYGSKSRNGTLVAATLYTLVETAKAP